MVQMFHATYLQIYVLILQPHFPKLCWSVNLKKLVTYFSKRWTLRGSNSYFVKGEWIHERKKILELCCHARPLSGVLLARVVPCTREVYVTLKLKKLQQHQQKKYVITKVLEMKIFLLWFLLYCTHTQKTRYERGKLWGKIKKGETNLRISKM